jgi:guanine deaminase
LPDRQTSETNDLKFLKRAVELSRARMQTNQGGPFGAVIVKDGNVIAEGWNRVTSSNDPTAHAEVVAIRNACDTLATFDLSGATLYSSCEPCPMCLAAAYWARISRLVFANSRDEAAAIGFSDADIYDEVSKPIAERTLPTVHMPLAEAKAVFAEWRTKPDKIEY